MKASGSQWTLTSRPQHSGPYLTLIHILFSWDTEERVHGEAKLFFLPSYQETQNYFFGGASWENDRTISCGPAIVKARLEVLHVSHIMNLTSLVPQTGHTGEFLDGL